MLTYQIPRSNNCWLIIRPHAGTLARVVGELCLFVTHQSYKSQSVEILQSVILETYCKKVDKLKRVSTREMEYIESAS